MSCQVIYCPDYTGFALGFGPLLFGFFAACFLKASIRTVSVHRARRTGSLSLCFASAEELEIALRLLSDDMG